MADRTRSLLLPLLLALLAAPAWGGNGSVFQVDSDADAPDAVIDGVCADAGGACTLRAAVQEANLHPVAEATTIQVPAGKYKLKHSGDREDAAATGDLDITAFDVTITGAGPGLTTIQGKKDRIFEVHAGATATIEGMTLFKGKIKGSKAEGGEAFGGGCVRNIGTLLLRDVVIAKCKAHDDGGGITTSGTLTLEDVTLEKNKAGDDGGGLDQDSGTVDMAGVTFAGNKAKDEAGGFEVDGVGTVLTAENVTLAKNKARETGGANVEQGGTADLVNVTFWKNKAKEQGGGVALEDPGDGTTITFTNVVLDANKPDACESPVTAADGSLEDGDDCGFGAGNQSNVADMGLGKIGDHGGPTRTVPLESGSPAIDAAVDAACPAADQRGFARVGACDSGAFEFQGP